MRGIRQKGRKQWIIKKEYQMNFSKFNTVDSNEVRVHRLQVCFCSFVFWLSLNNKKKVKVREKAAFLLEDQNPQRLEKLRYIKRKRKEVRRGEKRSRPFLYFVKQPDVYTNL